MPVPPSVPSSIGSGDELSSCKRLDLIARSARVGAIPWRVAPVLEVTSRAVVVHHSDSFSRPGKVLEFWATNIWLLTFG